MGGQTNYLKNRFASLSNVELFVIVNEKFMNYTDEALAYAKEEFERRGLGNLTKEEILAKQDNEKVETVETPVAIRSNSVASFIKFIGYLGLIIGLFVGIGIVVNDNPAIGIIVFVSSIISCTLFIGFGEVINLLHKINEKLNQ